MTADPEATGLTGPRTRQPRNRRPRSQRPRTAPDTTPGTTLGTAPGPASSAGPGSAAARLLAGGAMLYALLAGCGLLVTRVLQDGWLGDRDRATSRWFFEHRTPALDAWTHLGSLLADTVTAIAITVVLVIGLRLWLGRWRESLAVLVSILGELFIFVLVTATVHRQRPTVPHLDPAPPTSSFPSGHTGAAVALYVGLAVVLLSVHRLPVRTARVAAVLLCAVPVLVAVSRVYRGMHFLTDVLAGAVAGGLWTAIVMSTLLGVRTVSWSR